MSKYKKKVICILLMFCITVSSLLGCSISTTRQSDQITTSTEIIKNEYRAASSSATTYVYAITSLNVRTGPGTSYKIAGVLSKGDKVKLVSSGKNWSKITYKGKTRYASSKYLAITSSVKTSYVYATTSLNVRSGAGTSYKVVGVLSRGEKVKLVSKGSKWSKIIYNGKTRYASSKYLATTKPGSSSKTSGYPLKYSDKTCNIEITKEWYQNAYCYIAHLKFTDYDRFGTACANGKYNNGYETTSHAAKRLGAIFAVNGCYSAPNLNYPVARSGMVWNNKAYYVPAVYSSKTGRFYQCEGNSSIQGQKLSSLVSSKKVSDTFCFGPAFLMNGKVSSSSDTSRAQRTFIGTNGKAGDIWIVVSEGRYADGKSAGLTYAQCAKLLKSKGCTFGIPLDGGGSSTMYFNGKVLNSASSNQRAVVDFIYFK